LAETTDVHAVLKEQIAYFKARAPEFFFIFGSGARRHGHAP
jgi:hypothetical protein